MFHLLNTLLSVLAEGPGEEESGQLTGPPSALNGRHGARKKTSQVHSSVCSGGSVLCMKYQRTS